MKKEYILLEILIVILLVARLGSSRSLVNTGEQTRIM